MAKPQELRAAALTCLTLAAVVQPTVRGQAPAGQPRFDDYGDVLSQLGIRAVRRGPDSGGDPKRVDARGSFMAAVLAGPVYRLLGKKGLGTPGDDLTDPMPPVGTLIGGERAWRQHAGDHNLGPNWAPFFEWVARPMRSQPLRPRPEAT
jgi:hypothetical protein